jgi:hypothetical protein
MNNPFQSQNLSGFTGAHASADGRPDRYAVGVTLDTAQVPAAAAEITLVDGDIIPNAIKYLPFGAIIVRIGASRLWKPWDGAAALVNSETLICNTTCKEGDQDWDSAHSVCYGGQFFPARLKSLVGGVWTPLTAAQLTTLTTAMPRVQYKRVTG